MDLVTILIVIVAGLLVLTPFFVAVVKHLIRFYFDYKRESFGKILVALGAALDAKTKQMIEVAEAIKKGGLGQ